MGGWAWVGGWVGGWVGECRPCVAGCDCMCVCVGGGGFRLEANSDAWRCTATESDVWLHYELLHLLPIL